MSRHLLIKFAVTGDEEVDRRRIRILFNQLFNTAEDAGDLFSIEIVDGKKPKIFDWLDPVVISDDLIRELKAKGYQVVVRSLVAEEERLPAADDLPDF